MASKDAIHEGIDGMSRGCQMQDPKGRAQPKNKHSIPHQEPNQSTQSIRDIEPTSMYMLSHDKRLLRNECFNA